MVVILGVLFVVFVGGFWVGFFFLVFSFIYFVKVVDF